MHADESSSLQRTLSAFDPACRSGRCNTVSVNLSAYPLADGDGLLGHGLGVGDIVLHDGLE